MNKGNIENRQHTEESINRLMYVASTLKNRQERILKAFEIGIQHYQILLLLERNIPEPLCAGDIKCQLPDRNPDLTRLIDKLERKGLVERKKWPGNMRKMAISISNRGRYLMREIRPMMEMFYTQIHLQPEEVAHLESLINKLNPED